MNEEFETFKTESQSLIEKGVKAAGPRARKATLELEKILKEFRKVFVQDSKKQYFPKKNLV
ncbi:histone H1 [Flavobacterium frigoris]|uniref:histone H1 n=1 Tax=Flavobacterium frigoris TaxID=229204 RepID=UPI000943C4A0|nr:histone H1 [Flavobacterium frigoris]